MSVASQNLTDTTLHVTLESVIDVESQSIREFENYLTDGKVDPPNL